MPLSLIPSSLMAHKPMNTFQEYSLVSICSMKNPGQQNSVLGFTLMSKNNVYIMNNLYTLKRPVSTLAGLLYIDYYKDVALIVQEEGKKEEKKESQKKE